MLCIDQLSLCAGKKILLQKFSARISSGERIGIFGPNGAGKSTFLKALLGTFPFCGSISFEGAPLKSQRAKIAYLPQDFEEPSLDYSVLGFLGLLHLGHRFGIPKLLRTDLEKYQAALQEVDALPLQHQLLSKLSGGERKRVMLAGLLLNQPQLCLLDEPLSNLDPRYQRELIALLGKLQQKFKLTLLITAHDFNPLLPILDRVMFIGEGQALLDVPERVIEGAVLSRLYRTPLQVVRINERSWVLSDDRVFLQEGLCGHAHV